MLLHSLWEMSPGPAETAVMLVLAGDIRGELDYFIETFELKVEYLRTSNGREGTFHHTETLPLCIILRTSDWLDNMPHARE